MATRQLFLVGKISPNKEKFAEADGCPGDNESCGHQERIKCQDIPESAWERLHDNGTHDDEVRSKDGGNVSLTKPSPVLRPTTGCCSKLDC